MRPQAFAAALAASALAAPAAHAATVSGEREVTFRAGPGERNLLAVLGDGDAVRFRDRGAQVTVAGALCRLDGADAVCGPGVLRVRVFTGDGNDLYRGGAPADLGPGDDVGRGESIRGRGGADVLTGTRREDLLLGGPGADVLRGGGVSDLIRGGRGRDVIFGGSGGDEISAFDGQPDVVMCGRGADYAIADAADILVSCEVR